jgi:ketohexokinase
VLADDSDAEKIRASMKESNIQLAQEKIVSGHSPVSYIVQNVKNGSRTIVHYRDLPEYRYEDFQALSLESYDWIHFEGRNPDETMRMMKLSRERTVAGISLEIEKPREGIEDLISLADVIMLSRDYALKKNCSDAPSLIHMHHEQHPDKKFCLAWGKEGAWGIDSRGKAIYHPAFEPGRVVDTLAAGDTFNAAFIHACIQGRAMDDALQESCRLAGFKCGQQGLSALIENSKTRSRM